MPAKPSTQETLVLSHANPMMTVRRWRPGEEAALWQLKYRTIHTINRADYSDEQDR